MLPVNSCGIDIAFCGSASTHGPIPRWKFRTFNLEAFSKYGVEDIIFSIYDPFLSEVEAMEACVLDSAEPIIPLNLSRVFLQSVLGLYEAARSGQVVGIQPIETP